MKLGRAGGRRVAIATVLALGLAAVTIGALGVSTVPAHAQQSLIDSDPAVVRARAEVDAAQEAAHVAEGQLEATNEQLANVQAAITDAQQKIADLDRQRAELAQQRDTLFDHLRQRAVALYAMGGDGAGTADLFSGSALEGARRKTLSDAAARSDRDNARKLQETRSALADTQTDLRHQQDALVGQQAQLDALSTTLQGQQAAVEQRVADANAALDRARAIGALHAANDPVMGPAILTVDQMTAWFAAQGYHPRLNDTSVAELAQIFLEEGADENVRGDFAFAQAIVETGGFSAAPDHNYSGLGWCDTCTLGTSFPTPRDGIRAQIQLLLDYADPGSRAANLHHPPSPYWWSSDPDTAARRFDSFFAKGWAPTWLDMGHGNWATDPNYAGKVVGIYNSMLAFSGVG